MTRFTLANAVLPVRKSTLSLLFALVGLMFHLSAYTQTIADVAISKMVNKSAPSEGDTITYTITVSNTGPGKAQNIQIKDSLPAGITFISASATKSSYSSSTGIWGANNAIDLNSGQTATLTIKAKVNAGTLGTYIINTARLIGFTGTDPDTTDNVSSAIVNIVESSQSCFCNLQYPDNSNAPRSLVVFNESEVLRAFDPGEQSCDTTATKIKVWYNDEHALTLGVHQVNVKTASGTTTTNYPITATPSTPTCVDHPLVGTTIQSGDQTGNDPSDRPLWPALYLTDITANRSSRAGDWQQGGMGTAPHTVCGTWKGAIRTIDNTTNPPTVSVTPDADPAKNNWTGIPDVPPGGFASLTNQGYGAEIEWNIHDLGLDTMYGHTYRLQFLVHDGDQNKSGGDAGEGCSILHIKDLCPDITVDATPPSICSGFSSTLTVTNHSRSYGTSVVGWFLAGQNGCTPTGSKLGTGTSLIVSPTLTTTYVVIVTNSDKSCNDTACVTVTVHAKPVLTLAEGPTCDNTQSSYSITLSITGTGPFTATATAGTAVVTGNSVTISGIPSGSGTIVTVTDASGCSSDPYNQAPHTCCPDVTASASPPVICVGESSTLSFTGTPGVTVVGWFAASTQNGCTAIGPNLGTGTTLLVTPSTTSTYVVVVTNSNQSCNDTSNCVTVTVHAKPVLTLADGPNCDA